MKSHSLTDNQCDRRHAPQNSYDFKSDYGPVLLDRRHALTAKRVYELPFFREFPASAARSGNVGPGYGRWDLTLAKNIKFHEDIKLQFRAEMSDIFNHTNLLVVNTASASPLFGQGSSARDPRLVRPGLTPYF